jgi:hypothetical protein
MWELNTGHDIDTDIHFFYAFYVTCPYNPPCSDRHNNMWGRVQITYFHACSCYFEDCINIISDRVIVVSLGCRYICKGLNTNNSVGVYYVQAKQQKCQLQS